MACVCYFQDADPVYAGKRVVLKSVCGRQDLEGQIGDAVSFDEVTSSSSRATTVSW